MKNFLKFLIIPYAFFFACTLFGNPLSIDIECKSHPLPINIPYPEYNYPANPHISDEVWELVKPYLLPSNHPLKRQLDAIFSRERLTQNVNVLSRNGFARCYVRSFSHLVVTKHPMLRGYWLKLLTDEQDITDYPILIHRIKGAHAIREAINQHGYNNFFSVPNKWLYPLPPEPSPPSGHYRKNFILIAEDMNIYKKKDNYKKWHSKISPPRALAIYTLLQELGLNDCIYPFNLPFCENGKQAFIDTEHHHNWPVRFHSMTQHLPKELENYWQEIIDTDGHPN